MIGSRQPHVADCTNGVDPAWVGAGDWAMSGHIAMGWARSPRGPWSEPRIVLRNDLDRAKNRSDWDYYVTNPSASVMPNGTVMLVRPRPLRLGRLLCYKTLVPAGLLVGARRGRLLGGTGRGLCAPLECELQAGQDRGVAQARAAVRARAAAGRRQRGGEAKLDINL